MKLSLYIARRYLFARKSRNAINVISSISVAGVMVGSMALIIVLSVFNGLEDMVKSIFGTFDPDLEITLSEGKVFVPEEEQLVSLVNIEGVESYSLILEENALLKYGDKQHIATIKGVEDNYNTITGLDSAMWDGEFKLRGENGRSFAVVGMGVAGNLNLRLNFVNPLFIYVPKRVGRVSMNPDAFIRRYLYPSGIFSVEQSFDSRYIFIPIDMMRELLMYENEISALELKLSPDTDVNEIQSSVSSVFGEGFTVKNKYQQQEIFYKVMKSERLAIFFILTFILIIASFNIVGSITMLIIEKEKDIGILRSLGANNSLIRKIFILEGWMISILGAVSGLALGGAIGWLQMKFGLLKLGGETLIIDTYPVAMKATDFMLVLGTVLLIGYIAAWYPVRYMSKKYLEDDKN